MNLPANIGEPGWAEKRVKANQLAFRDMSLRDWFAGQALSGNLASQCKSSFWAFNVIQNEEGNKEALQGIARLCYDLADAMLAQREKDTQNAP